MSAYNRGELSIEAYLVRILAALCRQNSGELRVKGELIDTIGEATTLLKSWDSAKQELVLTVAMGSFGEVYRVVPERQAQKEVIAPRPAPSNGQTVDPLDKLFNPETREFARKGSTLEDNEKLTDLENKLKRRRVARMVAEELAARRPHPAS
jgi:hypothetical protein